MMAKGWVKAEKAVMNAMLKKDKDGLALYCYCLIRADHDDTYCKGVFVPRGSFVTTLAEISSDLSISMQSVRSGLANKQNNKQINIKSTNKYTMITICSSVSCEKAKKANQQTNNTPNNKQINTPYIKETIKETIEKKEDKSSKESAKLIYESYPTRDPKSNRRIAKRLKDIDTIAHLIDLGTYTADQLQRTVDIYKEEHKTGYVQDLKTFLNNIPDYGTAAVEQPKEEQSQSNKKSHQQW